MNNEGQSKFAFFREFKRYSTENDPNDRNLFGKLVSGDTRASFNPDI